MLTGDEWQVVGLSAGVAAASVLLSLPLAVVAGWVLARWTSPARVAVQGVVMLPLVLPPVVTGYLLLSALGRGGPLGAAWEALTGGRIAYTTGACVIAASVVGFPLVVEGVRLSVLGVDPRLELMSRSLGQGRLSTFLRVTLPLASPGLIGGAVLGFARAMGEFGATIVLAGNIEGQTRTIAIAVYTLMNSRDGEQSAARLVTVSVVLSLGALVAALMLARVQRRRAGLAD